MRVRRASSAKPPANCGGGLEACPAKLPLADRPLLSAKPARELAGVFKILANDSRVRLLHALVRAEELSVSALAETVGMTPQAISNQLQRLAKSGIVGARREGTTIYYRMVDPCVIDLLDRGLCLTEDAKERTGRK